MKSSTPYSWAKPFKSERDICEIVCNSICGNLLLNDQFPSLEVWKERILKSATVTICVFNSNINTALIRVLVIQNEGGPVELTVPPGNTLSATVDDAESIIVSRIGVGRTEGKFNLEVCFPFFCNDKHKYKKC
ncbi:S-Ena type endospore appendage [Bacillus gobiensis]|uniref:S-Ena type endospore appendage n=1 Tax=Bacillus gobiensis TaxID=1441095 RepID=UPI003D1C5F9E